jgi:hypothetical protein
MTDMDEAKAKAYYITAGDLETVRLIERMESALSDEKPTRQERRQMEKRTKRPKALRGRP